MLAPATLDRVDSGFYRTQPRKLKTAANRRVEAELTVVRLCTMGGEAYDTLSGRVDALEEKVKHGITVHAVATPVQTVSDEERPPLPGDEDAPPPLRGMKMRRYG